MAMENTARIMCEGLHGAVAVMWQRRGNKDKVRAETMRMTAEGMEETQVLENTVELLKQP